MNKKLWLAAFVAITIICVNLHILTNLQIGINSRLDKLDKLENKLENIESTAKSVEELLQTVIDKASDKYGVSLQ